MWNLLREREGEGDAQRGGLGVVRFRRTAPHHSPANRRYEDQPAQPPNKDFELKFSSAPPRSLRHAPASRTTDTLHTGVGSLPRVSTSGGCGDGLRRLATGRQGTERMAAELLLLCHPRSRSHPSSSSHTAAPAGVADGTHPTVALHALHGATHRSLLLLLRARSARRARRVRAGGVRAHAGSAS